MLTFFVLKYQVLLDFLSFSLKEKKIFCWQDEMNPFNFLSALWFSLGLFGGFYHLGFCWWQFGFFQLALQFNLLVSLAGFVSSFLPVVLCISPPSQTDFWCALGQFNVNQNELFYLLCFLREFYYFSKVLHLFKDYVVPMNKHPFSLL